MLIHIEYWMFYILNFIQLTDDICYPKQLCEDCTTELVMVAKFREKCSMSTVALDQLKRQIGKLSKSKQTSNDVDTKHPDTNTGSHFENFDYCEGNVEYVIEYDTSADIIEEVDHSDKSHEILETDYVNSDGDDNDQTPCSHSTDEVCLPKVTSKIACSNVQMDLCFFPDYITENQFREENFEIIEKDEKERRNRNWRIEEIYH